MYGMNIYKNKFGKLKKKRITNGDSSIRDFKNFTNDYRLDCYRYR